MILLPFLFLNQFGYCVAKNKGLQVQIHQLTLLDVRSVLKIPCTHPEMTSEEKIPLMQFHWKKLLPLNTGYPFQMAHNPSVKSQQPLKQKETCKY